jgi:hypothetical protein
MNWVIIGDDNQITTMYGNIKLLLKINKYLQTLRPHAFVHLPYFQILIAQKKLVPVM